jgi:hypothetical protein
MTDLNLSIALIVIGSAAVAAEFRADDRQRSPAAAREPPTKLKSLGMRDRPSQTKIN